MTEQQMKDAMNRTHIPAGALATYAPPLGTVLLDYADKVWQDLVSAVDIVIDFLYTEGEEIEIPGGTKQIDGSAFEEKEPEYTIDPKYADLVVMEEELRANYLESSSYAILFETLPGGSSENVYYEPTRYIYDMTQDYPQVLAEFGNSPEMRTGYSYANNQRVSGGKDSLHYYLYDGRTSVSALISGGSVAASYGYDPFGQVLEGAPAQDRIFGFNGEEYTPQTGMIYLRARHYSPSDGRFTTQDTYLGNLMDTVSQNRYAYCGNDPVNYIDPSGYVTIAGPNSNSGSSAVGSNSSGSSSSTTFGQGGILSGGSNTGLDPGDYAPGAWASTGPKTINSYSDDSSGSRTYTSTTYSADGKSSTKVEIFIPDRYNPDRNPVVVTKTSKYGGKVIDTVKLIVEAAEPIPLGGGKNTSNVSEMINNVKAIEALVENYLGAKVSKNGHSITTNTLNYLRKLVYDKFPWSVALPRGNSYIADYINAYNTGVAMYFMDNRTLIDNAGNSIDFLHMIASISGQYSNNSRLRELTELAGDMISEIKNKNAYNAYTRKSSEMSDLEYYLSRFNVNSYISAKDIYADVDAINLYNIIINNEMRLSGALDYYYNATTSDSSSYRFNAYYYNATGKIIPQNPDNYVYNRTEMIDYLIDITHSDIYAQGFGSHQLTLEKRKALAVAVEVYMAQKVQEEAGK